MHKMRHWKRLIVTLSVFLLLTACGQKGDLYLPEGKSVVTSFLG